MQDNFILGIAEIHVVKTHLAAHARIGQRTVLVGMLPCPDAGTLRRFVQLALFVVLGVDQRNIAVVLLGQFVHQLENTVRACHCHNNRVQLLGNLGKRHGEAFCQLQKGCDIAQRKRRKPGNRQRAAHNRGQHVLQIAQVRHNRHQDIREPVGTGRRVAKLVVQLVEALLGRGFVAEYLDNLLTVHHFLNITIHLAKLFLLLDKVPPGAPTDKLGRFCHQHQHDNQQQGQLPAQDDHGNEHADQRNRRGEHIRDTLADHLPQRVGIVGKAAHNFAVGVGIKVLDGQLLHMGKHFIAHLFEHAL